MQFVGQAHLTEHELRVRRREILRLRARGCRMEDIPRQIEIKFHTVLTVQTVQAEFRKAMEEWNEENAEDVQTVRSLINFRLDLALEPIMDKVELGSLDHIDTMLKIETTRAKLLGINVEKTSNLRIEVGPRPTEEELRLRIDVLKRKLFGEQAALPKHVDTELADEQSSVPVDIEVP